MSVSMMSLVYKAHFHDITFVHKGKKKSTGAEYEKQVKVMNFNLKSVCLALADHANDEGEGAYPAVETIASKTEISDVTVIACLKAMKQEGIISYVGRSKWDTCNYTVKKEKLVEMATWERQQREKPKSKAALVPDESKATSFSKVKPLHIEGKATLPDSSLNHPIKPSIKRAATPKPPTPEEVKAFRQATRRNPNSVNYPDVVESVRKVMARLGKENIEDIVIDELSKFYRNWTSKGYNPLNLAWLEWAELGTVPANGTWRPTNANYQGNTGAESYSQADRDAAERIRKERGLS